MSRSGFTWDGKPRRRKSDTELADELAAAYTVDAATASLSNIKPWPERLRVIDETDFNAHERLEAHMVLMMDHAIAEAIRADGAEAGQRLRAMGFHEIAEALRY